MERLTQKGKGVKKCIIKGKLKFKDFEKCLENNKIILRSQQRSKSEAQNIFTEEFKRVALHFNDNKTLQSLNRVNSYLYGSVGKAGKEEWLLIIKKMILEYTYYQRKMINFDDYTGEN